VGRRLLLKSDIMCTCVLEYSKANVCQCGWPRGVKMWACDSSLAGNAGSNQGEEAWMSVSCECRVLSNRGLCDGPITRPEESYRVWCV
jgi:hypothetical protein